MCGRVLWWSLLGEACAAHATRLPHSVRQTGPGIADDRRAGTLVSAAGGSSSTRRMTTPLRTVHSVATATCRTSLRSWPCDRTEPSNASGDMELIEDGCSAPEAGLMP
jgi:hypothetical protein